MGNVTRSFVLLGLEYSLGMAVAIAGDDLQSHQAGHPPIRKWVAADRTDLEHPDQNEVLDDDF